MDSLTNGIGLIASIAELHSVLRLQPPVNPLVSIVPLAGVKFDHPVLQKPFSQNYYSVTFLYDFSGETVNLNYGDDHYRINNGLICVGAGQVQSMHDAINFTTKGFVFAIHPDFFVHHFPALDMKEYGFFSYAANEGLVLTEEEYTMITTLFSNVDKEISNNTDDLVNTLIASHVDLLLNYCQRFYNRQFISLKKENGNRLIQSLDEILDRYFESRTLQDEGFPSVQYISDTLKFSPNYLSDMLRAYTGKSTNQHIQDKAVETAKRLLYKTDLSIAEIAYSLGFEYPQNFNKFFKRNTSISPQQYRLSLKNNPSG